jgi:hypothetical protein
MITMVIIFDEIRPLIKRPYLLAVRPAGRVARKRNRTGCGGQSGDLEV